MLGPRLPPCALPQCHLRSGLTFLRHGVPRARGGRPCPRCRSSPRRGGEPSLPPRAPQLSSARHAGTPAPSFLPAVLIFYLFTARWRRTRRCRGIKMSLSLPPRCSAGWAEASGRYLETPSGANCLQMDPAVLPMGC